VRGVEQALHVGRELPPVAGDAAAAPALAGPSNAQTRVDDETFRWIHAQLGVRSPWPLKRNDGRRALADTAQVEAVPVDEVRAAAERRVRRGRRRDRLEGAADGDEQQHGERRIEDDAARPAVQRAAGAAERPATRTSSSAGQTHPASASAWSLGATTQIATPARAARETRSERPALRLIVRRLDPIARSAKPVPSARSARP
jgi:hypothetical protein